MIVAGPLGFGVHSGRGTSLTGVMLPVGQPHDVGQYEPVPVQAGQFAHAPHPVQVPAVLTWQLEQPELLVHADAQAPQDPPPRAPRQWRASAALAAKKTARAAAIRNSFVERISHLHARETDQKPESRRRDSNPHLRSISGQPSQAP